MSQEKLEQRFEVGAPASLKLSNIRGPINIQTGEDGLIVVTALKMLNSGNAERTSILMHQEDSGRVILKTEYQNPVTDWFNLNKPCKVEYTLQVPKNTHLDVNNISGSITVGAVDGEIQLSAISGSLNLSNLTGPLKLSTVSGAINAHNLRGVLDVNAVSGQVRVTESNLVEARVKTVSGSIVVETPLTDGPYAFKGVSGKLTLIVPAETACVAIYKSVSGRLKTSLPITQDHREGSRGWLEIQGGGPEVTYKSVSGSFKIVTSENEEIPARRPASGAVRQPKNQLEILQKIESGSLSVEDALKELNA